MLPRFRGLLPTAVAVVTTASCSPGSAAGGSYEIVADVREVMLALTVPASDAVWAAGSEPPADEAGWRTVERSALALAESGNLLLMPGRAVPEESWRRHTLTMIGAARRAVDAARARDLDALLDSGDAIYGSCESCHQDYMPR